MLFFVLSSFSFSQINRCSTDEYREALKTKGLRSNFSQIPKKTKKISHGNYSIPVVVHILYNNNDHNISDARILSQIDVLNNDYNALNSDLNSVPPEFEDVIGDVGFSFCLAQIDPNGNACSGVNRVFTNVESFQGFTDNMKQTSQGGVDAWDTDEYLNIWVCDLAGNTLGFATMPGDVEESPELDGIVIDYEYFGVDMSSSSPYNLGRTGTHEVGHYFGLEHTFLAGCSSWDNCDDTPAISSPTYGCPSFPQVSCQSNNMTMNFMDYTNDACMYMFTSCQTNVMVDVLLGYRSGLLNNNGSCSTSIRENEKLNPHIFPNPLSDLLYVNSFNTDVYIMDLYGRIVFFKHIIANEPLDLSLLSDGTYFLYLDTDVYKIIKH